MVGGIASNKGVTMGVYLFSVASSDEVKVSGVLCEVLPASETVQQMDASAFLDRLTEVEGQFRSSRAWRSFVASGGQAECDALVRDGHPLAAVPGSPTWPWFENHALLRARALAEAAFSAGTPVCWA